MPDSDSTKSYASLGIYNPGSLEPEVLLEEFIARRHQLNQAIEIVRNNVAGEPVQHLLVYGPRGMGKTMFLLALAYKVQRDDDLSREWLPVIFPEESYGIGDLADFWLMATIQLLQTLEKEAAIDEVELLRDDNPDDIEERARALFLKCLEGAGKRALIVLENLHDFFESVSDEAEQHRLRAFLMENDRLMLAGSSPSYFDAAGQMEQPFYDFFRVIHLDRFKEEEMISVLTHLAELRGDGNVNKAIETQPDRIKSLHVLTGGNPRLIKMIYRLLSEGGAGTARADLDRLLEDCTPYFKHRIEELSREERRVFDHVAKHWDPVAVGDIQKALRRPSNKVSTYLRRLVNEGYIEEAEASTAKRKSYQVAERFYNIYYLMRFSRSGRHRLSWLIAAMRVLYSGKDFERWTRATLEEWKGTKDAAVCADREAFFHSLAKASDSVGMQREIVDQSIVAAWDKDQLASLDRILDRGLASSALGEEFNLIDFFARLPAEEKAKLGYEPNRSSWWYELTWPLEEQGQYELAEAAYRKAIELDSDNASSWNALGNVLNDHLKRYEEAEEAFRKAIELNSKYVYPWYGLGKVLAVYFERYEEAEEAFRKAIELDSDYAAPWNGLGCVFNDFLKRYEEAEEAYRNAIALDPENAYPFAGLSDLYAKQDRLGEARELALQGACLGPDIWWPRSQFLKLCGEAPDSWLSLLPALLAKLSTKLNDSDLYEFALRGLTFLLSEKRITPAEAIERIAENSLDEPFADILLALKSIDEPDVLAKTSPERRAFARDFVERISSSGDKV